MAPATTSETFTDSGPDVQLHRSSQQAAVWTNNDLDAEVFVMRCKRIGQDMRVGFPTKGYLMRARWITDNDASDIWWCSTLSHAEEAALIVLNSRDEEPDPSIARLMSVCQRGGECEYANVGLVPFKWLESEATWCCPKCGWFE